MFNRWDSKFRFQNFEPEEIFEQVIEDYDFDKDGKLNLAEYKQYLTESEESADKE